MSASQRATLAQRKNIRRARQQRRRKIWAAISAFAIALPIVSSVAMPAVAAETTGPYLEVTKNVDKEDLLPGQDFTYSIDVVCSQTSCLNAQLVDQLPSELENYALQDVNAFATDESATFDLIWSEGEDELPDKPDAIGPNTKVAVDFTGDVTSPSGEGLQHGTTFSLKLTLRVPDNIEPGLHEITNTASTTADNAFDDEDSALIRVEVPVLIDVAPTKSWQPSSQSSDPGAESKITLGVENTSNVAVDSLVLQEPQNAPDGAADLHESNPFTITDFAGFGTASLPDGVYVQVDAYVKGQDGNWAWEVGSSSSDFELPDGVTAADVGGLRFTYNGDLEPGVTPNVDFSVSQRAEHRNSGDDLSTQTHTVNNVAEAVARDGDGKESERKTATANYRVNPANIGVAAAKNIQPNKIDAGDSATASITATNGSSPVQELRLADLDFFTSDVKFGGFTQAPSWPEDATGAKVIYHLLDSDQEQEVTFGPGETPAKPDTDISGFEIVYTAAGNDISSAAHTTAVFEIETVEKVDGEPSSKRLENTLTTTAIAANKNSATSSDKDTLEIVTPAISVVLDKRVRPGTALRPGESAFVELPARATATDRATIHDIAIKDAIGQGEAEFWDAFDLAAIAPTQVPGGTVLTVEVWDETGGPYTLSTHAAQPDASIFQMSRDELQTALQTAGIGSPTGIEFSFTNENGFAKDVTVAPNLVFDARSTLRSSGDPVSSGGAVEYRNSAIVGAEGVTGDDTPLEDNDDSVDTGTVLPAPDGSGELGIQKQWQQGSVDALSDQKDTSSLRWKVSSGFDQVSITDPADQFNNSASTIFDAFNLVQVKPIEANSEQFTNGWYLKYDTITSLELYIDNDWQEVNEPTGGWIQSGRFVGYQLGAQELEQATGVRITLAENEDARSAALESGADPFAPEPGSGVASSSIERVFDLEWQVRDAKRSNGDWVTGSAEYNLAAEQGMVNNRVALTGTKGSDATTVTADAKIKISDHPPLVAVTKSINDTEPIFVTDQTMSGDKPSRTWTIMGHHAAVPKAGHVRIMDPAPCAQVSIESCQTAAPNLDDPFANADVDWLEDNVFKYFDVTGINLTASITEQVDLEESVIWLLRYHEQNGDISSDSITGVGALIEADLANVIVVSVTFQAEGAGNAGVGNTITQDNRFTIEIESTLRETARGETAPLQLGVNDTIDLDNRVFAQSYDDILVPDVRSGDTANAESLLTGGDVAIAPFKSLTPGEIVDANPDVEVTATLRANQGTHAHNALSPSRVVIEDQAHSGEFWNTFNFTGLGEVTFPAGANRVQVDLFGAFADFESADWVEGDASADAELPINETDFDKVEGIRFIFTRDDGQYFDPTPPPANNWEAVANFTVELRDTYRDSGDEVVFDGTITNTQTSQSFRVDGKNSTPVSADAEIVLSDGTQQIAVKIGRA